MKISHQLIFMRPLFVWHFSPVRFVETMDFIGHRYSVQRSELLTFKWHSLSYLRYLNTLQKL